MRSLVKSLLLLAVVLAFTSLAQSEGQSPPAAANADTTVAIDYGGVYLLQLAHQTSVQTDLGLNRTQRQDLDALERRLQKQATAALKKGPRLFSDRQGISPSRGLVPANDTIQKDAADALATVLSDGQTARLKQIALQQQGPQVLLNPAVAAKLQLTDAQVKAIARLTPLDSNKIDRVLTGEQHAVWHELTGAPFRGRLTMSSPPGPPTR